MHAEIEHELERIVGGRAVNVADVDLADAANPRVKLETANASYNLPANRLLTLLQELPDHIGVAPLREAIEQRFPSVQRGAS